jgi:hypothetical protein
MVGTVQSFLEVDHADGHVALPVLLLGLLLLHFHEWSLAATRQQILARRRCHRC